MATFGDKRKSRRNSTNFLVENNHFRNLHLIIYFVSLCVLLIIYTLILIILGKSQYSYLIMILISVCIGIFLVFKRDEIVKKLSDELDKRKRIDIKKRDRHGLKNTINNLHIKPSKDKKGKKGSFNMKISSKTPIKDKVNKIKRKFEKKGIDRKGPDYIEVK